VTIHLAQHLQYIATLVGKVRRYFHELSSSVGEAVRQQNLHLLQPTSERCARVRHTSEWAGRVFDTLLQHVGDVLAGVLAAGEVQRDLPTLAGGHDAAGEHTRALVRRFARET
jgi:hypothetical protein